MVKKLIRNTQRHKRVNVKRVNDNPKTIGLSYFQSRVQNQG